MTKSVYLEMCEQLGTAPKDNEIPVELEDMPSQVQTAFRLYYQITDRWDYMSGEYIGKDYSELPIVFKLYNVDEDDKQVTYELLRMIDNVRAKEIANSKPKSTKPPK